MINLTTNVHDEVNILCCNWTKPAIINCIKFECIPEENKRIDEILSFWEKSVRKFSTIYASERGIGRTIDIKNIPSKYDEKLRSIREENSFQTTFGNTPFELKIVEIDKLVASQFVVRQDFVKRLTDAFPKEISFDDLIDICLRNTSEVSDLRELSVSPDSIVYSSENPDSRFLGATSVQASDIPNIGNDISDMKSKALVLFFGYGIRSINVLNFGGRMYLGNGFHRVYALRKAGIIHIPVVVRKIINPEIELPPVYMNVTRDFLLKSERLPIIKDYFDPDLNISVKYKAKRRAIKVKWVVEEFSIPL